MIFFDDAANDRPVLVFLLWVGWVAHIGCFLLLLSCSFSYWIGRIGMGVCGKT